MLAVGLALLVGTSVGVVRAVHQQARPATDVHYTVRVLDPAAGVLHVRLDVSASGLHTTFGSSGHAVAPANAADRFRVRRVIAAGSERPIEQVANGWTAPTDRVPTRVEYEVHLATHRDRGAFAEEALSAIDSRGGRLLGSDVFLFPIDQDVGTIAVDYELPDGWALHHPFGTGPRSAAPPDVKALYSSAVAIGDFRHATRRVQGVEIRLAIRGAYAFGDDDLLDVIERIVAHQLDFFGRAPHPRYLFVVDEHPHRDDPDLLHYFGLHFEASMVILLDPRTDRRRLQAEPASLCAHEFFHNWLGERLRQEDYAMNWFVEGVTTLYSYRTRLATGMLDHGRYATEVAERHRRHWAHETLRRDLPLAEAGSIVLQDETVTRMTYTGGLLVGIALDDAIVARTAGTASLDDVLRTMVDRAGSDPEYRLTRATLEAELARTTGADFSPWLERYVYGVDDLPLPAYVTGR